MSDKAHSIKFVIFLSLYVFYSLKPKMTRSSQLQKETLLFIKHFSRKKP